MAYKKFIRKKGKVFGPYIYESVRSGDRVETRYIGREGKLQKKRKVLLSPLFVFFLLFLFIALSFRLPFLGKANIVFPQSTFQPNEQITGNLDLYIKEGELIPGDTLVSIDVAGQHYETTLQQLAANSKNIQLETGNFYAEGLSLSGSGTGFGIPGEKTVPVDIYFKLKLKNVNLVQEATEEDIVNEVVNEITGNQTSEIPITPAETQSETPASETSTETIQDLQSPETPEVVAQEIVQGSIIPFFDRLFGVNLIDGRATTIARISGKVSDKLDGNEPIDSGNEKTKEKDKSKDENTSLPAEEPIENINLPEENINIPPENVFSEVNATNITEIVTNIVDNSNIIIDGTVNINLGFSYSLNGREASIIPGSVRTNDSALDESVLILTEKNDELIITTRYMKTVPGFGVEYVTGRSDILELDLSNFGIKIGQPGSYEINISLTYQNKTLTATTNTLVIQSENITEITEPEISPVEENLTNETNQTIPEINLSLPNNEPVLLKAISDITIQKGKHFTLNLSEIFYHADADALTYAPNILLIEGNNTLRITIENNLAIFSASGESRYNVKIIASDSNSSIESNQFSVEVFDRNINHAPRLLKNFSDIEIYENKYIELNLLDYFSDFDNDALQFTSTPTQNITVEFTGNTARIIPDADFAGTRSLGFNANDGNLTTSSNAFTVSVVPFNKTAMNHAPKFVKNISDIYIIKDGNKTIDIAENFADEDNDSLNYRATQADNLTLTFSGSSVFILPDTNFTGSRVVYFFAYDGIAETISNGILINVTETEVRINHAPKLIKGIPSIEILKNENKTFDISQYYSDEDGDTLAYRAIATENITFYFVESKAIIVPETDFTGSRHTYFFASDDKEETISNAVLINVTGSLINVAPKLVQNIPNISLIKNEQTSLNLSEYFIDEDNQTLEFNSTIPENISITFNGSIVALTPDADFTGERNITFSASDGQAIAESNLVFINVEEKVLSNDTLIQVSEKLGFGIPAVEKKGEKGKPVEIKGKDIEQVNGQTVLTIYSSPVFDNIDTEVENKKVDRKEQRKLLFGLITQEENQTYNYSNEQNLYSSYFGDKIRWEYGGSYITFEPKGEKREPIIAENTLIYHDIWPNASLGYALTPTEIKEYIILLNQTLDEFDFDIQSNVEFQKENEIINVIQNGHKIAEMPQPFVIDANETRINGALHISGSTLTISFKGLLNDAVYPVLIDPTLALTNISASADIGGTGATGDPAYDAILKFDISSIPATAEILDARLGLYASEIISAGAGIYGYNCSNQSWTETNFKSTLGWISVFQCGSAELSQVSVTTVGWKRWLMTTQVNESFVNGRQYISFWMQNYDVVHTHAFLDTANNGNLLRVQEHSVLGSDGAYFNSSEATGSACGGTSCKPYLQINYSSDTTAPVINATGISPSTAYSNSTLNCSTNITDDIDTSLKVNFTFYSNAAGTTYINSSTKTYSGTNAGSVSASVLSPSGINNSGGTINCTANVSDAARNLAAGSSTRSITNIKPMVKYVGIEPGTIYGNTTMNCNATVQDDDVLIDGSTRQTLTLNFTWYNGTAYFNSSQFTTTNATNNISLNFNSVNAGIQAKNERWNCTVNVSDGTASSNKISNATILISNTAPTLSRPNFTLFPTPIMEASIAVNCTVTAGDLDLDSLTYTYLWYKNNQSTGVTTQNISQANYVLNDVLTCQARANDGSLNSALVNSSNYSVRASNNAPTINKPLIEPATAYANSTLNCSTTAYDVDLDPLIINFTWYNGSTYYISTLLDSDNGTNVSYLLSNVQHKGETWNCSVFSSDGTASSAPNSSTRNVANTAPTLSLDNFTLTPSTAYITSIGINCTVNAGDADNDALAYSYLWYKNNQSTAVTTQNITNSSFTTGDVLTCEAVANDGTVNSEKVNSSNLSITNGAPTIQTVSITPATAYTNSTLNCSTTVTDIENETVLVNISWYNGSEGTTYYNSSTFVLVGTSVGIAVSALLPDAAQGKGETWNCTANASDASSDSKNSITTTISNTAPTLSLANFTLTPSTAYTTSIGINCTVNAGDADNDALAYSYLWYKNNQSNEITTQNITEGNYAGGDVLTCEAVANDGTVNSEKVNSSNLSIRNPPWVDKPLIQPLSANSTDTLNCSTTARNNDLNTMTVNFTWYNGSTYYNSSTFSGLANGTNISFTLNAGIQAVGETWNCSVFANDGLIDGRLNSTTKAIQDLAPWFTGIAASPTSAVYGNTVNFSATVSDDILVVDAIFSHNFDPTLNETENITGNSATYYGLGSSTYRGQIFKLDKTAYITRACINVSYDAGIKNNILLQIRRTTSQSATSLPASIVYATSEDISSDSVTTTATKLCANFSSTYLATSGYYALVLASDSSASANTYRIRATTTNTYSQGRIVSSSNSGGTWSAVANRDLDFWVETSSFNPINESTITFNLASALISKTKVPYFQLPLPSSYSYRWYATDNAGQLGFSDVQYYYARNASTADTTSPVIQWMIPPDMTYFNGIVSLLANCTDNTACSSLTFYYMNSTMGWNMLGAATKIGASNWRYNWNTATTATTASYDLKAEALDPSNNSAFTSTRTFVIDHLRPRFENLTAEYPSQQASAKTDDTIILRANITDGSGAGMNFTQVDMRNLNGSGNASMSVEDGEKATGTWTLFRLSAAINAAGGIQKDARIYAFDNATPTNNFNDVGYFYVDIDNTSPTSSECSESFSPVYAGQNVVLTCLFNDEHNLSKYIFSTNKTGSWVNSSIYNFTSQLNEYIGIAETESSVANVSWRVYFWDDANNTNTTATRTFEVKDTAAELYPNIYLISPDNDSSVSRLSINFTYNVTDVEVSNCGLFLDGIRQADNSTPVVLNGNNSFINTTLALGTYSWSVSCIGGGNENLSETRTLTAVGVCGDGICDSGAGESTVTCPQDCRGGCSSQCIPGDKECLGSITYRTCGDYNGDGCSEWSSFSCPTGQICSNGNCVACIDDCTLGTKECVNSTLSRECITNSTSGCEIWKNLACISGSNCNAGYCLTCNENWTCSDWDTACNNHMQERICTDSNNCGTSFSKPSTNKSCNNLPVIIYDPQNLNIKVYNGTQVTLSVSVTDADNDALGVDWQLDGVSEKTQQGRGSLTSPYSPVLTGDGSTIIAIVSDGYSSQNVVWAFSIYPPLLWQCEENWNCDWTGCDINQSREYAQNCTEDNKCGTTVKKPFWKNCACISNWTCSNWSDCEIRYNAQTLIEETDFVIGQQTRICEDMFECYSETKKIQARNCTKAINIRAECRQWCGENYLELTETDTGILVGRVKEYVAETKPSVNATSSALPQDKCINYGHEPSLDIDLGISNLTSQKCWWCYDGMQDYDEEGVDCGGRYCPKCSKLIIPSFSLIEFVGTFFFILAILLLLIYIATSFREKRPLGYRELLGKAFYEKEKKGIVKEIGSSRYRKLLARAEFKKSEKQIVKEIGESKYNKLLRKAQAKKK